MALSLGLPNLSSLTGGGGLVSPSTSAVGADYFTTSMGQDAFNFGPKTYDFGGLASVGVLALAFLLYLKLGRKGGK